MSKLFQFRPAREAKAVEDARVIVDLDRLLAEPICFRFRGKAHLIKPINNETFFRVVNALARLDGLAKEPKHDINVILEEYARLFASVCDTVTRQDVNEMSVAQIGALFQQIVNCVTGKAYGSEEKKNAVTPPQAG